MRLAAAFAIVLFIGVLVTVRYLSLGMDRDEARVQVAPAGRERVESELAALKKAHAALADRVRMLEEQAIAAPGGPASGSAKRPAEAKPELATTDTAEASSTEAEPAADREEKLAAAIEALTRGGSTEEDWRRIWSGLAKDGLVDDAVAAFEERVKAEPRNADRHAALGAAYLQKLVTVNDLEKGPWAMKADKSFDDALAVNERHWDARFTKAAALSYWPAITGKPAEAMKHFETLCAQQEEGTAQKKFANTYLMLGNLYQSQGNAAKANETWRRGAELHPDNAELRAKGEAAAK